MEKVDVNILVPFRESEKFVLERYLNSCFVELMEITGIVVLETNYAGFQYYRLHSDVVDLGLGHMISLPGVHDGRPAELYLTPKGIKALSDTFSLLHGAVDKNRARAILKMLCRDRESPEACDDPRETEHQSQGCLHGGDTQEVEF